MQVRIYFSCKSTRLIHLESSDSSYFYLHNEAGNVILILEKTDDIVFSFEQDAWGNDLYNTFANPDQITQHQTGTYYDAETGLYYFSTR